MNWKKINESDDDNETPVIGIRLVKMQRKRGMTTWIIEKWDEESQQWAWSKSIDGTKSEAIKELNRTAKDYFDVLLWSAKRRETT